jgi:transposase
VEVNEHHKRVERIETELEEKAKGWRFHPVVEALHALRGIQFTVALSTVAELGDLSRFDSPRQLMSYLGLTPSEYSTGNTRRLGGSPRPAMPTPGVASSRPLGPIATTPR